MAKSNGKRTNPERRQLQALVVTTVVATGVATAVSYFVNRALVEREKRVASELGGNRAVAALNPRLQALAAAPAMTPRLEAQAPGQVCPACNSKAQLAEELELLFADV